MEETAVPEPSAPASSVAEAAPVDEDSNMEMEDEVEFTESHKQLANQRADGQSPQPPSLANAERELAGSSSAGQGDGKDLRRVQLKVREEEKEARAAAAAATKDAKDATDAKDAKDSAAAAAGQEARRKRKEAAEAKAKAAAAAEERRKARRKAAQKAATPVESTAVDDSDDEVVPVGSISID